MIRLATFLCFWAIPLVGCNTGSRDRACEPIDNSGCAGGKFCIVDFAGVPRCAVALGVQAEIASTCAEPEACGPKVGCIRVNGVARCRAYCRRGDSNQGCGDKGRCLAALPDRPDIEVCVYPCEPDQRVIELEPCPMGSVCTSRPDVNENLCAPATYVDAGGMAPDSGFESPDACE